MPIHLDYDPTGPPRRPSTWKNVPVVDGGYRFDSKAEHRRWQQLVLLEKAGAISDLLVHPRYQIVVNGHPICTYIGDFQYEDRGQRVTEDVKGRVTDAFRIKSKLMRAVFGITVREVFDT
jgi:hypothetical protein